MHEESKQFFDGLLLGSLVIGLIIVTFIAFILFNNDDSNPVEEVRDLTEVQDVLTEQAIAPLLLAEEAGQSLTISGKDYLIHKAVEDQELGITYRGLVENNDSTEVYASLWSQNGAQLNYLAETDLLTISGANLIQIQQILSDHSLLLQNDEGQLLEYDLKMGLVKPWEKSESSLNKK